MNNFSKLIVILFVFCIAGPQYPAQAASNYKLVKKGNSFFSAGKYDEAINAYDEAAVNDPESPYIYFNKGTALYKKEDFAAAIDAFGHAAIKSKDIFLESKSRYNLGLCFFREGERQKDNDLKKALESYSLSVQSFQEALVLDSEFEEAAENIEMVRLIMKSLLDEIKKKEEEAKKQQEQAQKIAEHIKKLIKQQDALLQESQSLLTEEKPKGLTGKNQKIADAQVQLKQETQNLSQQLSSQQQATTSSSGPVSMPQEHPSKQHLDNSVVDQGEAVQKLSENDTQTALYQQEKSLEDLNKALDALQSDQSQECTNPQQQQGEQQQSAQQDQSQGERNREDEAQDDQSQDEGVQDQNTEEERQQSQEMQLTDNADSILEEEKENNKQRKPFSSGGFKEVDKDW